MTDTTAPRTAAPDLTQNLLDSWPNGATYAFTKEAMETVVKAVRLHEREAIEPLLALVRAAPILLSYVDGHTPTTAEARPPQRRGDSTPCLCGRRLIAGSRQGHKPGDALIWVHHEIGSGGRAAAIQAFRAALPESVRVAARKPE